MSTTTRKNDGSRLCPMCGQLVAAADRQCPACGEPMLPSQPAVHARDRALALGIGGLSACICGYWIVIALQATGGFAYERELPKLIAVVLTFWFWGPPIIAVLIANSRHPPKKETSRWRVFWQTQAVMYAISLGLTLLCTITCMPR